MSNLNYKIIFRETIVSMRKNPTLSFISSILFFIPIIIFYLTSKLNDNLAAYYIISILLFLSWFIALFLVFGAISQSYLKMYKPGTFKPTLIDFSRFILTTFLSGAIVFLSALPTMIALFVLGFSFYKVTLPYDKLNFNFMDLLKVLKDISVFLFPTLAVGILNLPLVSYVFTKVGFAPLYSLTNQTGPIESISQNLIDTKKIDFVDSFLCFLILLVVDFVIIGVLIYLMQQSTLSFKIQPGLLSILIPCLIVPFQLFSINTMFKQLSRKDLFV